MTCKHNRYTLDIQEQIGHCFDCGAEGRMRFVVGDPVRAERERIAKLWTECTTDASGHGLVDIGASIRAGYWVDAQAA